MKPLSILQLQTFPAVRVLPTSPRYDADAVGGAARDTQRFFTGPAGISMEAFKFGSQSCSFRAWIQTSSAEVLLMLSAAAPLGLRLSSKLETTNYIQLSRNSPGISGHDP